MIFKKIFPYYVEFYDHNSKSEWQDKKEVEKSKLTVIYLIGWLVAENTTSYKFSMEVTDDQSFGDTMLVHKKTIKKLIKIKTKFKKG
jgi:hypothetical protein